MVAGTCNVDNPTLNARGEPTPRCSVDGEVARGATTRAAACYTGCCVHNMYSTVALLIVESRDDISGTPTIDMRGYRIQSNESWALGALWTGGAIPCQRASVSGPTAHTRTPKYTPVSVAFGRFDVRVRVGEKRKPKRRNGVGPLVVPGTVEGRTHDSSRIEIYLA